MRAGVGFFEGRGEVEEMLDPLTREPRPWTRCLVMAISGWLGFVAVSL